jgi:transcriptional regulator
MYIPSHFQPPGDQAVADLLTGAGASDLVTWNGREMVATTLPLLYDPSRNVLEGHVARNNTQWRDTDALVIVKGPDAYVSPSAYQLDAVAGRTVPTWNYVVAHVYGTLIAHDDVEWTSDLVRRLTSRHEAGRDPEWSVDDAPPAYIAGQLRAIVGIEIAISRIEAKWKLSQNRSVADAAGVIEDLRSPSRGTDTERAVADAMDLSRRS